MKMKAKATIRRIQRRLEKATQVLPGRASDQAYGASEALRWVLGTGPALEPFTEGFDE